MKSQGGKGATFIVELPILSEFAEPIDVEIHESRRLRPSATKKYFGHRR